MGMQQNQRGERDPHIQVDGNERRERREERDPCIQVDDVCHERVAIPALRNQGTLEGETFAARHQGQRVRQASALRMMSESCSPAVWRLSAAMLLRFRDDDLSISGSNIRKDG